jgi:hypothetical protein
MDTKSKIEELQKQIDQIKEQEVAAPKEKYAHLVGKCFRTATASFVKVTNICSANECKVWFDCVDVYFDERCKDAYINTSGYNHIDIDDLSRFEIKEDAFNEAFKSTVRIIKNKISHKN